MNAADWAAVPVWTDGVQCLVSDRPARSRPPRRGGRTPLDPARRAAFDVLRAVSERDAYANLVLPPCSPNAASPDATPPSPPTAYGACRTRGVLDAVIAGRRRPPVDQIDPVLLDLLRLGAYQLLRTRVEQHAAVATTVDQAGIEFDTARAGFVNGVLRSIARRDEQSWLAELAPPAGSDPVGHTAFVHAHPRWIAQAFADALGADAGELDAALAADDARPAVHLAARPGVLTAGRWPNRWTAPSAAIRRMRCTSPPVIPTGWRRSATVRRWCRTRAASWWPAP